MTTCLLNHCSSHLPLTDSILLSSRPEQDSLTNVAVLARSVDYIGRDNVPQIVFYDAGVGTEGSGVDRIMGGATGVGIDLNIQQLYSFLAMNYDEGDEIYMFGFSRGSYTVRSLAGMMNEAGLLYRSELDYLKEAYDLYRDNEDVESERARNFRSKHSRRVPITLLACFDTVGALGIPKFAPFPFSLMSNTAKYRFHDTKLCEIVENAIHAVAIDEDMIPFEPTLMAPNDKVGSEQLSQKFLSGRHGGVGGGTHATEPLARNALKFVVEEMERRGLGLSIDKSVIPAEYTVTLEPSEPPKRFSLFGAVRWSMGTRPRKIASVDSLHPSALKMYKNLENWRPASLEPLKDEILKRAA